MSVLKAKLLGTIANEVFDNTFGKLRTTNEGKKTGKLKPLALGVAGVAMTAYWFNLLPEAIASDDIVNVIEYLFLTLN